jgi:hypothetical protein
MKKLMLFAFLNLSAAFALCQDITLKIGTEATYQIDKASGKKFSFTLVETKNIDQSVDMNNDLFKEKVDSNIMKIAFVKGKMSDRPEIFLVIKTGRAGMIKYSAKIKYTGRSKFVSTDVNMIIGTVKTMEMWQNDISEIMLSDFEEGSY